MKTKEEIQHFAKEQYLKRIDNFETNDFSDGVSIGYQKAIEDFSNSWTKGCECKESKGQTWCCNLCGLPYASNSKTDKIFNRNELFEVANKIWNDMSNNDTLTYNSFGEYFKNEFKKYL